MTTDWMSDNNTLYALGGGTPKQVASATLLSFNYLNIKDAKVIKQNDIYSETTGVDPNGRKVTVISKYQENANTKDGPQFNFVHKTLGTSGYGTENLVSVHVESNTSEEYPLEIYNKIMFNLQSIKQMQYAT